MTTETLTRIGDRFALVLDDATLARLGVATDTPLRVAVVDGAIVVTPLNDQGRAGAFAAAVRTMSARYEKTLRRLAE